MARARILKPGFFTNEILTDLSPLHRLLFAGLWTLADRAGRLEDRPRRIKTELLHHDDCDVDQLLSDLAAVQLIHRYHVDSQSLIQVIKFVKHQHIHPREARSELPGPEKALQGPEKALPSPEKALPSPEKVSMNRQANRGTSTSTSTSTCVSGEYPSPEKALPSPEKALPSPEKALSHQEAHTDTEIPELHQRANQFIERFGQLYRELRHGATYHGRPSVDFERAKELVEAFPNGRLELLVKVFLKTDETWIANSNRSIPVFASRASWCDDRLREVEQKRGRA